MDFLASLANRTNNHTSHLQPPELTLPSPLHLATAKCDPYVCTNTRTSFDPKARGGAVIASGVPAPSTQKRWKRVLTLPVNALASVTANAWEDESGDGSLVYDTRPSPPPKHHTRHYYMSNNALSAEDLCLLGPTSIPDSQLVASTESPSFEQTTFSLASSPLHTQLTCLPDCWSSLITSRRLRLSAPAKIWRQEKSSKQLERLRVELKRDPNQESLTVSKQNSKYGKFDAAFVPGRRIALSMIAKEPLWNRMKVQVQSEVQTQKHKLHQGLHTAKSGLTGRKANGSKSQNSTYDDQKSTAPEELPAPQNSESLKETSEEPLSDSAQSELAEKRVRLRHAQEQLVRRQLQLAQQRMEKRNISFKSDLEYNLKDGIMSASAAVEAFHASISIRSCINPLRVTPRVQIPITRGGQDNPWISWTRAPGNSFGEVHLGKKGLELSGDWQNRLLSLRQKSPNGSSTQVSVNDRKRVATIDKTLVTQPLLGAFTLTLIAHMTTAKNQGNILTATITSPFGAISASAATTRAVNLLADLNIDRGRRAYTIGLKVEEAKSFAARIGFHM